MIFRLFNKYLLKVLLNKRIKINVIAALVRETVNKLGSKKKKKPHIKVNIVVSAVGVTAGAYRQLLAGECGTYLDMAVMKGLAEEMILSQILRGERSQSCKG